jgi:hypothetical protein
MILHELQFIAVRDWISNLIVWHIQHNKFLIEKKENLVKKFTKKFNNEFEIVRTFDFFTSSIVHRHYEDISEPLRSIMKKVFSTDDIKHFLPDEFYVCIGDTRGRVWARHFTTPSHKLSREEGDDLWEIISSPLPLTKEQEVNKKQRIQARVECVSSCGFLDSECKPNTHRHSMSVQSLQPREVAQIFDHLLKEINDLKSQIKEMKKKL